MEQQRAWVDYDRDGYLDLFVGRYGFRLAQAAILRIQKPGYRMYCDQVVRRDAGTAVYHNNGDGTFTESPQSRRGESGWKSLGVAIGDIDGVDGPISSW